MRRNPSLPKTRKSRSLWAYMPRPLHRSRRDRFPSHDIFDIFRERSYQCGDRLQRERLPSHPITPFPLRQCFFFLLYCICRKKGQKAKTANMFSFGQAVRPKELPFGKYLYGVSPLTRSLISLISSRIWLMTLPGPF